MALSKAQEAFLSGYRDLLPTLEDAARSLESLLSGLLEKGGIEVVTVSVRAKSQRSVRAKLLDKGYRNPSLQMTDLVGGRVITLLGRDVDPVVSALRHVLDIDESNSIDKRPDVGSAEFGYRSVHVVASVASTALTMSQFPDLLDRTVEIQVRSLLDHAWAEVEHRVVYKSGVVFPFEFRREFATVAGTLEMVEREFGRFEGEAASLVREYVDQFSRRQGTTEELDAARLEAILMLKYPGGAELPLLESPTLSIRLLLKALHEAGIMTPSDLLGRLRSRRFGRILEAYCSNAGLSLNEPSHAAVAALVIGVEDRETLELYLPEWSAAPAVSQALSA